MSFLLSRGLGSWTRVRSSYLTCRPSHANALIRSLSASPSIASDSSYRNHLHESPFYRQLIVRVGKRQAHREAWWLLEHVTKQKGTNLRSRNPTIQSCISSLSQKQLDEFESLLQLRANGHPLQYLLGYVTVASYRLAVRPPVLIPRVETEQMVDWICYTFNMAANNKYKTAADWPDSNVPIHASCQLYHENQLQLSHTANSRPTAPFRVLDVCSGSGNIALSLAAHLHPPSTELSPQVSSAMSPASRCPSPCISVIGLDISNTAIELAQHNKIFIQEQMKERFKEHGQQQTCELDCAFIEHDIFSPISSCPILASNPGLNLICSNPPYIDHASREDLSMEVLGHEDHAALFADDPAGLSFYERILQLASTLLLDKAEIAINRYSPAVLPELVFEIRDAAHSAIVSDLCVQGGFSIVRQYSDLFGNIRWVAAARA